MIGLEQWRAAVGAWHAGSTRAYRRYVNGRRRIVCNWQKLLFHTASIHYSVTWFIAVLFAFVSGSVASALGFNVDCRYSQSLCTQSVKSPSKVCHDSTVRSCAADLCRLLKSATPSLVSMLRLLSALRWLLIVAGDVELNPGPVSQELEKLLETTDASVLLEDDLFSVYCEVLDLAPNWMNVGLMLGLRNEVLKRIRTTYHDRPRDCLKETLEQWLKQTYNTEKSGLPTWKKMVEVTAHPVAGNNPALAATLARNHQGTAQTARSNPPQAKPSIDSSSTAVLRYAQYLRGKYQTEIPTFLTLQWPPPPSRKIFNLAMIRGQNIRYGPIDEDMVRLTLTGRVKDILYQKTPVKMKDILQMDNAERKVILIEGPPGSGKSTLAWHVCQTWGSGELFQNYRSVVYVQLRDPTIQSAQSIEDIIPAEGYRRDQAEEVMAAFQTCHGQDLLFVMDGWDELPLHLHTESIFQKLIAFPETLSLELSAVIITSRPIASSDLYHYISSRIEVLGFTPSEVKDYFTEALRGESQAVQKLQDQLKERPMVETCCYIPLNAAIVTHLFLAQNQSLPTTLHGVFTLLVVSCLKRHVAKQEREMQYITALDSLPSDIELLFKDVYTLAYHGVMDNRATFSLEYLESRGLPKIIETLGLIQGVESFTSLSSSPSYCFLHLSVQELLASYYISKLPEKEQVVVFNKIFGEPRFAAVFRFYAAFTKLQTEGIRKVVARIVQNKKKHQILYLLHGLYEAQTLSLCQFVYSQLGGQLNLSDTTLSPVDCLAVGYFISCICLTGSGEFEADLARCSIDSYRVSFLTKELSKCTRSASTHKSKLAVTDTEKSSCLELALNLLTNHVGAEGAALLCGGNIIHLLRTLNLTHNEISDKGGREIAEALKTNQSLTTLHLDWNQISDEGSRAIAESLKVNRSLTTLDLSYNEISDDGCRPIAEALYVNKSLTTLHLSGNNISDEGGRTMTKALKVNKSLTTLGLELRRKTREPVADGVEARASQPQDVTTNDTADGAISKPQGIVLPKEEIDLEKDRKLLESAMKEGYINARFLKVIFTGAAGVGKTHAICLLRGVPPPDPNHRQSTECAKKAITIRVDAANDEEWEEIDQEKRRKIIAEAICAAEESKKEQQPAPTPSSSQDPPKLQLQQKTELQQITQPQPKPEQTAEQQPKVDQKPIQLETQQEQSQQSVTTLGLSQTIEDLLKTIREVAMSGTVSGKILEIKWVYVVDTGGQPPFHELLSAFIKGASACAFVFKLSERLDHRPLVEYWSDGKKVCKPFNHPLSNQQILEQSIQTIEALPCLLDKHSMNPLLFVIGTHRDEQDKCTDETLEDKERILHDIVKQSGFNYQYYERERIVFDVNAKKPEPRDKGIAFTLRREIADKIPGPEKIPLRYYGLELVLEHLATTEGMISLEKCCAIGDRLNFDEEGLKAALRFLHSLNVLLYYPEVKEVEKLIFCDPLVLIKIVSKVVERIYRIRHQNQVANREWMDSCKRGLITIQQLNTEEFCSFFRNDLFTPKSLFKLFEHLLIVAKVNEKDQQFFMPCLLDDLMTTEITRPNCDNYGPLVFQFLKRGHSVYAPSGLFSALVAFLLSQDCCWTIKEAADSARSKEDADSDVKVYRNILTFHSRFLLADITLINFLTSFEVFAVCDLNCLPKIRSFIVDGLNKVKDVRNFKYVDWKETFTCKCGRGERHLADIDIERKQWSCPDNPKKRGCLENTELAWYEESEDGGGGSSSGGTDGHSRLQCKGVTIIRALADQRLTRELADNLWGSKMITRDTYDLAKNFAPGVVGTDRATVLFDAVLASVKLNPANYDKFITILKQIRGSKDLVDFIKEEEWIIGKKLGLRKRKRGDWEEQGEYHQTELSKDTKAQSSSDEECSRSDHDSAKRPAERQPEGLGSLERRRKTKKRKLQKEEELEMSSNSGAVLDNTLHGVPPSTSEPQSTSTKPAAMSQPSPTNKTRTAEHKMARSKF